MATGTSIYNIITTNRLPDGLDTFTAGGFSLGSVNVKNFYGDISVGEVNNNANGQYLVSQIFSDVTEAQDNIMCVRIFHGNLTIASGTTFTPTHRTKGLFVFVKGNLINEGTITMSSKGSSAGSANVYLWSDKFVPASGQPGADGVFTGSGGGNLSVAGGSPDVQGKLKPTRGTGGGGSASVRRVGSNTVNVVSAAGSAGTSWSGGFGSGGISTFASSGTQTGNAPTSTTGGAAKVVSTTSQANTIYIGGGSGVLGGDGLSRAGNTTLPQTEPPYAAADGTAGLLMIACLGAYTNNGIVSSVGTSGGTGSVDHANGGASGGGSINIVAKSIGGTGASSVAGGTGTSAGYDVAIGNNTAGSGGDGSYTAQTLTADGVTTQPRRTLIKTTDGKLWYRNFSAGTWQFTTGAGTTPFETYGMFDAEVYALDKAMLTGITGVDISAVTIQTYTP